MTPPSSSNDTITLDDFRQMLVDHFEAHPLNDTPLDKTLVWGERIRNALHIDIGFGLYEKIMPIVTEAIMAFAGGNKSRSHAEEIMEQVKGYKETVLRLLRGRINQILEEDDKIREAVGDGKGQIGAKGPEDRQT